ncbi:hypothetical protein Asi03nite_02920 [Actinoplanes siamensis]|uniref:Uncharacterized protein n=1 Tax=Actinoplanes siamensis TaxID=1223317 RepID=A0A919KC86_9ACTN|nr:hypothetical protein Asi03nite_02920 [Actinoplanes siamensis]
MLPPPPLMAPTPSNVRPPDVPLMVIAVAACAGAGFTISAPATASSRPAAAAQPRDDRRRFGPWSSHVVIGNVVPFWTVAGQGLVHETEAGAVLLLPLTRKPKLVEAFAPREPL